MNSTPAKEESIPLEQEDFRLDLVPKPEDALPVAALQPYG